MQCGGFVVLLGKITVVCDAPCPLSKKTSVGSVVQDFKK